MDYDVIKYSSGFKDCEFLSNFRLKPKAFKLITVLRKVKIISFTETTYYDKGNHQSI